MVSTMPRTTGTGSAGGGTAGPAVAASAPLAFGDALAAAGREASATSAAPVPHPAQESPVIPATPVPSALAAALVAGSVGVAAGTGAPLDGRPTEGDVRDAPRDAVDPASSVGFSTSAPAPLPAGSDASDASAARAAAPAAVDAATGPEGTALAGPGPTGAVVPGRALLAGVLEAATSGTGTAAAAPSGAGAPATAEPSSTVVGVAPTAVALAGAAAPAAPAAGAPAPAAGAPGTATVGAVHGPAATAVTTGATGLRVGSEAVAVDAVPAPGARPFPTTGAASTAPALPAAVPTAPAVGATPTGATSTAPAVGPTPTPTAPAAGPSALSSSATTAPAPVPVDGPEQAPTVRPTGGEAGATSSVDVVATPAAPVVAPSGPTTAAAPAAPSAPAPQPAPMAQQLARPLFTLAQAGPGEHVVTVTVAPEQLGPVTVRATVGGHGVHVELFAPSEAGREAVRAVLPDLRRDLGTASGAGVATSLDLSAQDQPHEAPSDGRREPVLREQAGAASRPGERVAPAAVPSSPQGATRTPSTTSLDVLA